ncbi:hypothetical protein [Viridibacterium curvum]|uniref:HepT-like ribonuclease domain-containing protein n=1 Tax=Viridibacterium curvum TaxID=1101404 RepID=UPI0031ECA0D2
MHTIEEAGSSILILTEGLEREEFLRSRLTRAEVSRQLIILGNSIAQLPPEAHAAMPEIGWDGWSTTGRQLSTPGSAQDDALWFAVISLVPATLMWLRVYRESQPGMFSFSA